MTTQQLALRLLKYLGVVSLDQGQQGNDRDMPALKPTDLDDCAACITGALQEITTAAPSFLSERRYASQLKAPAIIQISVTAGEYAFSATGLVAWMKQCTVNIAGDQVFNEIVDLDVNAGTGTLIRPHGGSTGTFSATVYSDTIALPSYVRSVLEPVEMPMAGMLHMVTDRLEFRGWNTPPYSARYRRVISDYSTLNKTVGIPYIYMVESFYDGTSAYLPLFFRVNPMPNSMFPVTMRIAVKPPTVTSADIITAPDDFTDPMNVIPMDFHESVLLPVALQRWTAHPSFKNKEVLPEIARQAKVALKGIVDDFKPQVGNKAGKYHP